MLIQRISFGAFDACVLRYWVRSKIKLICLHNLPENPQYSHISYMLLLKLWIWVTWAMLSETPIWPDICRDAYRCTEWEPCLPTLLGLAGCYRSEDGTCGRKSWVESFWCKKLPNHRGKLVGGLQHFLFSHILGIVIPIDELIFFRGVETTKQRWFMMTMTIKNSEWRDDWWTKYDVQPWSPWFITVYWISWKLGTILISRLWLYLTP